MKQSFSTAAPWERLIIFIAVVFLVIMAGVDIWQIAESAGHGAFLGHFDKIWGALFITFAVFSIFCLLGLAGILWFPETANKFLQPVLNLRGRLRWLKWLLAMLVVAWPAWLLMYTSYGYDLSRFAIRLFFFVVAVVLSGILLTDGPQKLLAWLGLVQGVIVFGVIFLMAKVCVPVTDFPLSLTWSEGNRLWDYSALFGHDLYIYPADKPIEAYIDRGRQSLWGLPFLLPGVTITQVRLWSALVFTVPYAIFGWLVFRTPQGNRRAWVVIGLWTLLFLYQGPIYTPLVLAAILVGLVRKWPWWVALPLIFVAGYYAQMSRLTWMFAPAIWAAMMAINDHPLELSRDKIKDWVLIAAYGLAGFLGGFGVSGWRRLHSYLGSVAQNVTTAPEVQNQAGAAADTIEAIADSNVGGMITDQALLWSRLWPNPTYPEGILLGLVLATGPLIVLLFYLVVTKRWRLNGWQKWGLLLPLMAFLLIGIVVSVKIGGGSNLHNLDMFLVGLVFVSAFAWGSGGQQAILQLDSQPVWLRLTVLLIVAIPAFYPMIDAKPLELPDREIAAYTVDLIQERSTQAVDQGGEVLFMDQRQLLTFGFVQGIPLVADYEKKEVMDRAMSGDREYFYDFYRDLANHRFALVITEPQNVRFATEEDDWGAENDIWVEWVTKPLICYYEPRHEVKKTAVWLLVPRTEPLDCHYP